MKKTKKVYIGLTADMLHHGHMKLLETARKYGEITIGLLTDSAVSEYKRLPYLNYKQREQVVKNFQGVVKVVPQEEYDYSSMNKAELVELAKKRGLPVSGTKKKIVSRLEADN